MKQNIIRELAKVTNTDMKDGIPLIEFETWQKQHNADKVGKLCHRIPKIRYPKPYAFKWSSIWLLQ